MLLDLGYTEIPITFDEWIKVMRELKAKYPDSIPYTSMDNLHWCEFVFNCYGISGKGCGWQPYMGKIIHNFENPLYKDALEVYKMMLNEGLMDPEFVTNKRQDFDDKRYNRNVLINQQNLAASFYFTERFLNNGIFNARPVPCQWAIVDDPRIDPEAVYEGPLPLGGHCVAVASTSQVKDAGLRFLEALLTEETKDLCSWGIENVDYKIVNGKKVVIPEAETPEAIGIWSMLHGYNQKSEVERDFSLAMERLKEETDISDEELNSYEKLCWDQFDKVMADAHTVPTRAMKFIILEADTLSRAQEAESEALTIAIKAMRGDITLEDFDVQAAAFLKKYQFITDEFNEKLPAAKALIE